MSLQMTFIWIVRIVLILTIGIGSNNITAFAQNSSFMDLSQNATLSSGAKPFFMNRWTCADRCNSAAQNYASFRTAGTGTWHAVNGECACEMKCYPFYGSNEISCPDDSFHEMLIGPLDVCTILKNLYNQQNPPIVLGCTHREDYSLRSAIAICAQGYSGSICEKSICDGCIIINTKTQSCSPSNGACICKPEYVGSNCDVRVCLLSDPRTTCNNTGVCRTYIPGPNEVSVPGVGVCACDIGWGGSFCTIGPVCPTGYKVVNNRCVLDMNNCNINFCSNGKGICVVANSTEQEQVTCSCLTGYVGKNCENSCDHVCTDGARVTTCKLETPGLVECICKPGFSGKRCQHDCKNACGHANSICKGSEIDDETVECICSGHGILDTDTDTGTDTCKCFYGFYGNQCEFSSAVTLCSTHSQPKDVVCSDSNGFGLEVWNPTEQRCTICDTRTKQLDANIQQCVCKDNYYFRDLNSDDNICVSQCMTSYARPELSPFCYQCKPNQQIQYPEGCLPACNSSSMKFIFDECRCPLVNDVYINRFFGCQQNCEAGYGRDTDGSCQLCADISVLGDNYTPCHCDPAQISFGYIELPDTFSDYVYIEAACRCLPGFKPLMMGSDVFQCVPCEKTDMCYVFGLDTSSPCIPTISIWNPLTHTCQCVNSNVTHMISGCPGNYHLGTDQLCHSNSITNLIPIRQICRCHENMVLSNGVCVCKPGTFYNVNTQQCDCSGPHMIGSLETNATCSCEDGFDLTESQGCYCNMFRGFYIVRTADNSCECWKELTKSQGTYVPVPGLGIQCSCNIQWDAPCARDCAIDPFPCPLGTGTTFPLSSTCKCPWGYQRTWMRTGWDIQDYCAPTEVVPRTCACTDVLQTNDQYGVCECTQGAHWSNQHNKCVCDDMKVYDASNNICRCAPADTGVYINTNGDCTCTGGGVWNGYMCSTDFNTMIWNVTLGMYICNPSGDLIPDSNHPTGCICPGPALWSGTNCQCEMENANPSRAYFDDTLNICVCNEQHRFQLSQEGHSCWCWYNSVWDPNTQMCEATDTKHIYDNKLRQFVCDRSKNLVTIDYYNNCQCDQRFEWNTELDTCVCTGGSIINKSTGKCECPGSTQIWTGSQCLDDCIIELGFVRNGPNSCQCMTGSVHTNIETLYTIVDSLTNIIKTSYGKCSCLATGAQINPAILGCTCQYEGKEMINGQCVCPPFTYGDEFQCSSTDNGMHIWNSTLSKWICDVGNGLKTNTDGSCSCIVQDFAWSQGKCQCPWNRIVDPSNLQRCICDTERNFMANPNNAAECICRGDTKLDSQRQRCSCGYCVVWTDSVPGDRSSTLFEDYGITTTDSTNALVYYCFIHDRIVTYNITTDKCGCDESRGLIRNPYSDTACSTVDYTRITGCICKGHMEWSVVNRTCQCPRDTVWNQVTQQCDCKSTYLSHGTSSYDNNRCICPPYSTQILTADGIGGCVCLFSKLENGLCQCPPPFVWNDDFTKCICASPYVWNDDFTKCICPAGTWSYDTINWGSHNCQPDLPSGYYSIRTPDRLQVMQIDGRCNSQIDYRPYSLSMSSDPAYTRCSGSAVFYIHKRFDSPPRYSIHQACPMAGSEDTPTGVETTPGVLAIWDKAIRGVQFGGAVNMYGGTFDTCAGVNHGDCLFIIMRDEASTASNPKYHMFSDDLLGLVRHSATGVTMYTPVGFSDSCGTACVWTFQPERTCIPTVLLPNGFYSIHSSHNSLMQTYDSCKSESNEEMRQVTLFTGSPSTCCSGSCVFYIYMQSLIPIVYSIHRGCPGDTVASDPSHWQGGTMITFEKDTQRWFNGGYLPEGTTIRMSNWVSFSICWRQDCSFNIELIQSSTSTSSYKYRIWSNPFVGLVSSKGNVKLSTHTNNSTDVNTILNTCINNDCEWTFNPVTTCVPS